jgi:hypothetical protein
MDLVYFCLTGVMLLKWTLGLVHLERMVCGVIGFYGITKLAKFLQEPPGSILFEYFDPFTGKKKKKLSVLLTDKNFSIM